MIISYREPRLALLVGILTFSLFSTTRAPASSKSTPSGHDFVAQVKLLYRIAACGASEEPVPGGFDARAVTRHCKTMLKQVASYKQRWATPAAEFIAGLRPAGIPERVVYPFGGGDLVSALVVFPDAQEITTISLEAAGDPRTIERLGKSALIQDLGVIAGKYQRLLRAAHSTTKSLQIASHSKLSGTLVFALTALVVHDFEPLSLRYFSIESDGSLRYLDEAELDAEVKARTQGKGPRRKQYRSKFFWREQDAVFANMEIRYRRRGDASAPVRVFRHIVANLDDTHLGDDGRVIAHLKQKGKVSAMTKAASYLLWLDDFSIIRQYLLDHAAWMISDSSGIPPRFANAAGFEQIPYGEFTGPYFYRDPKRVSKQMIDLWQKSPKRKLPFRFGYPDLAKHNHLLVMRPRSGDAAPAPGK